MLAIAAVLWDADGVLQELPPFESLWRSIPEETRAALLAETIGGPGDDVLVGRVDMVERVEAALQRHGLSDRREEILAVWDDFPPVSEARTLLALTRERGTPCVLASNQDTLRTANMRPVYEPLLDRLYFSADLGLAKPDPAFFRAIADDLAAPPERLFFIDDSEDNVAGARGAGLTAEHWHHSMGGERLQALLAQAGVPLD